ncbi:predicted protein [Plenodomus lingam JN3]|uniref:Predicted protein n=1 Tax=Leptosphaeria maculans (strain JN3 / isolate v23.1.3 / race Av1-4-5-6-7-8) TaxID=985895 RepID=E4ZX73_LEPMJ|nr:predicted protein [Plenodomus lingam JN3]CBX95283.1 predicted protein [Plenodomus lingam JN3]
MDRRLDMDQTDSPARRGPLSRARPPQLKLCGFRCGYGCEEPTEDDGDGGGGGGSDAASETTLIESIGPQGISQRETNQRDHDAHVLDTGSEAQHFTELSEHSDEHGLGRSSSLDVASCASSDRSRGVSAHGSVRMATPGPGIGVWADDQLRHVNRFPLEYYFLQSPLRLSAQYEHCRGDSLSHLVNPDRPLRVYILEDVCIEYMVGHRDVLVPRMGNSDS